MKKKIILLVAYVICVFMVGCAAVNENANIHSVEGKFYGSLEAMDHNGNVNTYYQFCSDDNEVWWLLTADEIGEVPSEGTKYTLTYDDNGTTRENKTCDCPAENDCECELYDDVFLGIGN